MAKLNIEDNNKIEIEMTDEERTKYLTMYVTSRCLPESIQVFNDILEDNGTIDAAVSQAAINEMVIEALHTAIKIEGVHLDDVK